MDENLIDSLDLMDIGFSFDGFEKIYQDLGKVCEVNKLVQISSKCLNFARKMADEVAADWFDTDLDTSESIFKPSPISEESKPIAKSEIKLNDNSNLDNEESSETLIGEDIKNLTISKSIQEEICTKIHSEPSTSQDYNSHVGTSTGTSTGTGIKMDEDTTARTNLVDFLKPHEFDVGGFEDVDLQDGWDDDVDYDLALASYHQPSHYKNHFKIKAAAKFISKLRRSKKTSSRVGGVTELPSNRSNESDWEIL